MPANRRIRKSRPLAFAEHVYGQADWMRPPRGFNMRRHLSAQCSTRLERPRRAAVLRRWLALHECLYDTDLVSKTETNLSIQNRDMQVQPFATCNRALHLCGTCWTLRNNSRRRGGEHGFLQLRLDRQTECDGYQVTFAQVCAVEFSGTRRLEKSFCVNSAVQFSVQEWLPDEFWTTAGGKQQVSCCCAQHGTACRIAGGNAMQMRGSEFRHLSIVWRCIQYFTLARSFDRKALAYCAASAVF